MTICNRCGREFNSWALSLPRSPSGGGDTCQKCRARPTPGMKRPCAKLTDYDVVQIRAKRAAGALIKDLAVEYRLNESTVSYACSRRSWKHVA